MRRLFGKRACHFAVSILGCICTVVLLTQPCFGESIHNKGDLACSPNNMRCGIITSCDKGFCKLYATHSINNGLPVRIQPQYIESLLIRNTNLYASQTSLNDLMKMANRMTKHSSSIPKRFQKVCYSMGFSNSHDREVRCGTTLSCNKTACFVTETHLKYSIRTEDSHTFAVMPIPSEYQTKKQIPINDIMTNGKTVEDFILWELVTNELMQLL